MLLLTSRLLLLRGAEGEGRDGSASALAERESSRLQELATPGRQFDNDETYLYRVVVSQLSCRTDLDLCMSDRQRGEGR